MCRLWNKNQVRGSELSVRVRACPGVFYAADRVATAAATSAHAPRAVVAETIGMISSLYVLRGSGLLCLCLLVNSSVPGRATDDCASNRIGGAKE